MKNFLGLIAVVLIALLLAFGLMTIFYIADTTGECSRYRKINPDIEFVWTFQDGCKFQLPDGTWQTIMKYEQERDFTIEIE
jgi:hypothetical protein